jgi:transcription elongation factor GreA
MRVPSRKPGQYSHLKPDPHMTRSKFNDLKNKLARLKLSQPRAAEEVKRLALMGDFSENAAYQIAKGRLRGINQRILDIEDHLGRAIIIEESKGERVRLGAEITVKMNGKIKRFLILGSSEADPSKGVISHNSPIGSALLGKKAGERAIAKAGGKKIELEIIKVE